MWLANTKGWETFSDDFTKKRLNLTQTKTISFYINTQWAIKLQDRKLITHPGFVLTLGRVISKSTIFDYNITKAKRTL